MKSWITGLAPIVALAAVIASSYSALGLRVGVGVLLAAIFGLGWPYYLGIPAKKTLGTIIALAGTGSAVAAALTEGPGFLVHVPIFIALGLGSVFVVQLVRGTGQVHRLESTLGAGAGVAMSALGSGWIAAHRFTGDGAMTLVTGAAALVALLVGLIRWPDRVVTPLGLVLAALAGPLAALLFSEIQVVPAAIVGLVVAAVVLAFRRLGTLAGAPRSVPGALAMGVAPVASLGALVYFVDKLLIT
ncbi:permease [Pseudarthrobacter sp. P1]|uniref:permease n=1 Tax=Pseudarthrobacter sp. P1 TaxID=3418418 RepID=UPI003CEBBA49